MTTIEEAIDAARARQKKDGNWQYDDLHCSRCGGYVGVNRWGEYPEYGSHGCLWGDARVIRAAEVSTPPEKP